jgi:hypothetical protein
METHLYIKENKTGKRAQQKLQGEVAKKKDEVKGKRGVETGGR